MKTMKKMFLSALVLMTLSMSAFAGNVAPTFKVTQLNSGKKVNLEVLSTGVKVKVQIIDENDVTLFEQSVEENFTKTLNLENLPSGNYHLVLTTPTRIYAQPLQIVDNKVLVNEKEGKEYFLPMIRQNKGFVDVSVLNNQLANVEVTILSENGEEVFTEVFRNQLKVERRYDVSNLEKGTYTIRMETPVKTIYQEVVVK